ncbi:alpha/beta hydrolase [Nocardia flavorosea]|uniref:Alpha/beta hydrolase n=1 Tax=Nocardia flavorosea TaxID=53429 RepID=A0A846YMP3_9NOCA|nr:alpha/beta hydrolase [Nocardia flavorosea]NKY60073.1 alpha/beta hydrolase [Nocardia flavorosea]
MTRDRHTAAVIIDDSYLPAPSRAALRGQWLTRCTIRPLMRRLPLNTAGIALLRAITAAPAKFDRTVPGTRVEQIRQGHMRGEWVTAPGVPKRGPVVLYVHGSAFVILSAGSHRGLVSRLSDRTGIPVFSVDYRLAPEHPFPAASDDVVAAYGYLIEQGYDPESIVLAGDSAGAHLCVDLALQLARAGKPRPAAMVVFSPLIDLTLASAVWQERSLRDPLITAADCRRLIDLYVGTADRTDGRLTLTFDGISDFPPTLIQAGGNEMLQADAVHLHDLIRSSGVPCHLQIWPGQGHVFQGSPGLPESVSALRQAAHFICHVLDRGSSKAQR